MSNDFPKINAVALGSTFAIIDVILHPLFHLWIAIAPNSYERLMNIFVAGLQLQVTNFDLEFGHLVLGTVLEATIFWLLGFVGAKIYNRFVSSKII